MLYQLSYARVGAILAAVRARVGAAANVAASPRFATARNASSEPSTSSTPAGQTSIALTTVSRRECFLPVRYSSMYASKSHVERNFSAASRPES